MLERLLVQPGRDLRVREDGFDFGGEDEAAAAEVVVERLDADAVAREHEAAVRLVQTSRRCDAQPARHSP